VENFFKDFFEDFENFFWWQVEGGSGRVGERETQDAGKAGMGDGGSGRRGERRTHDAGKAGMGDGGSGRKGEGRTQDARRRTQGKPEGGIG